MKIKKRTSRRLKKIAFWVFISMVLVGVIVLVISGARACGFIEVKPEIERTLPENIGQLFEVQTDSRLYYSEQCIEVEGEIIVTNFWAYYNKQWEFSEGSLTFVKAVYPGIKVFPPD